MGRGPECSPFRGRGGSPGRRASTQAAQLAGQEVIGKVLVMAALCERFIPLEGKILDASQVVEAEIGGKIPPRPPLSSHQAK